jgi:hypothetical protein
MWLRTWTYSHKYYSIRPKISIRISMATIIICHKSKNIFSKRSPYNVKGCNNSCIIINIPQGPKCLNSKWSPVNQHLSVRRVCVCMCVCMYCRGFYFTMELYCTTKVNTLQLNTSNRFSGFHQCVRSLRVFSPHWLFIARLSFPQ